MTFKNIAAVILLAGVINSSCVLYGTEQVQKTYSSEMRHLNYSELKSLLAQDSIHSPALWRKFGYQAEHLQSYQDRIKKIKLQFEKDYDKIQQQFRQKILEYENPLLFSKTRKYNIHSRAWWQKYKATITHKKQKTTTTLPAAPTAPEKKAL